MILNLISGPRKVPTALMYAFAQRGEPGATRVRFSSAILRSIASPTMRDIGIACQYHLICQLCNNGDEPIDIDSAFMLEDLWMCSQMFAPVADRISNNGWHIGRRGQRPTTGLGAHWYANVHAPRVFSRSPRTRRRCLSISAASVVRQILFMRNSCHFL